MYKDCLIFSFYTIGWIKNSNIYSYKGFFGLKTIDDQLNFLKPYLTVDVCYYPQDKQTIEKWSDVLTYAYNTWVTSGNFVLLVWFENDDEFGHAIPVVNGSLLMGSQYIGEQMAIKNASSFIVNKITSNTKCDNYN